MTKRRCVRDRDDDEVRLVRGGGAHVRRRLRLLLRREALGRGDRGAELVDVQGRDRGGERVKVGMDVYRERGGSEPPTIEEMSRVGMPTVVACTGCDMTMVVLGALVDEDGQC